MFNYAHFPHTHKKAFYFMKHEITLQTHSLRRLFTGLAKAALMA